MDFSVELKATRPFGVYDQDVLLPARKSREFETGSTKLHAIDEAENLTVDILRARKGIHELQLDLEACALPLHIPRREFLTSQSQRSLTEPKPCH